MRKDWAEVYQKNNTSELRDYSVNLLVINFTERLQRTFFASDERSTYCTPTIIIIVSSWYLIKYMCCLYSLCSKLSYFFVFMCLYSAWMRYHKYKKRKKMLLAKKMQNARLWHKHRVERIHLQQWIVSCKPWVLKWTFYCYINVLDVSISTNL